ncbi:MAG TPA: fluoride efflux transporter CrcB [Pseudolabrys sp.]|nr:fluoride efflux transporter CrcB [Pseudolabrys sp.]
MGFLIVFIGGGIGAALRHGFNLAFARALGTAFPYATVFENVSGSVAMGMLVALFAFRSGVPHHWQLFLTTGILGGYTTFSTFSLDVAVLYERGEISLAALYVLLSVILSIGGLFGGLALVRGLT